MTGLANKRVLVTGATQGIGFAVTERFLQEGSNVFLTDVVSSETLEKIIHELSIKYPDCVSGFRLDVTNEASVQAAFEALRAKLGGLDILVNNAGINRQNLSHEFTLADFDAVLNTNLRGAFLCSRAALQLFLEQRSGVILMNSSNHEIVPKPGFIAYAASKSGLGGLMRTLALEYADQDIRVNSVAPGATITPINASWKDDPSKRASVESHIPMGRSADPSEIAAAFAFLASDDARYITGQTLYVDGGLTLYADFRGSWAS
jgi:glucose 1-dehydrogenase